MPGDALLDCLLRAAGKKAGIGPAEYPSIPLLLHGRHVVSCVACWVIYTQVACAGLPAKDRLPNPVVQSPRGIC